MSEIASDTILRAMSDAYVRSGQPATAQLDVTYRCDLDCQHCYLDDRRTWPEMTTREWVDVLHQLAAAGVWTVSFSGGEVFQRHDFLELVQVACGLGFRTSFRTYGGLLTAAIAQQLAQCGVTSVKMSFYSLRPEVHDAFTRRPGSQEATLRGIEFLRAAGVRAVVDVVVQADTVEEIPALAAFFAERGVEVNFGTSIYRDHLARQDLDLLELTPEQRIRARELIWRHVDGDPDIHAAVRADDSKGPCAAGRHYLYISPDGAVWPCVMFPMQLGHLREHSFADIWAHSPERAAIVSWTNRDRTGCHSCAGSNMCFYCPGEAYKNTGDFRKPPPQFHSRTRDLMRGYELARGVHYTEAEWASVPEARPRLAPPKRFIFPIYRPQKGRATRTHDVTRDEP
jgi:radical SAM protein with 4Fe4S-binding SPASM domain